MDKLKSEILQNPTYKKFSEANEDIIQQIYIDLKNLSSSLSTESTIINDKLQELIDSIDVASAIFANFNRPDLIELSQRLKAITAIAQKKSEDLSALLKTAATHMEKLNTSNIKIFESLDKNAILKTKEEPPHKIEEPHEANELKFKWIIFKRNGSSFITGFKNFSIIEVKPNSDFNFTDKVFSIKTDNQVIDAEDLLRNPLKEPVAPSKILIIDNGKYLYAADKIGKEIHSSRDILTPISEAIKSHKNFSGRVRLFGENHFLLKYQ